MSRFNCTQCSYETNKPSVWNKHILTKKHLKNVIGITDETPNITKDELVRQCKVYGFKNMDKKTKEELSKILENPPLYRFSELVLTELIKKSNVTCIYCDSIGHELNKCSKIQHLRNIIGIYFVDIETTEEELPNHFEIISRQTQISVDIVEEIYNSLWCVKIMKKNFNIDEYFESISTQVQECSECKTTIYDLYKNTSRIWKNEVICYSCWSLHNEERNVLWEKIKEYKPPICVICSKIQNLDCDSFHYDHLNMFDKNNSICEMVSEGQNILDIYRELDKCQSMCLQCHHIITHIERELEFTTVKNNLTRKLTKNKITELEYDSENDVYKIIYSKKMNKIYEELRKYNKI